MQNLPFCPLPEVPEPLLLCNESSGLEMRRRYRHRRSNVQPHLRKFWIFRELGFVNDCSLESPVIATGTAAAVHSVFARVAGFEYDFEFDNV
jgi:hypothetical protein